MVGISVGVVDAAHCGFGPGVSHGAGFVAGRSICAVVAAPADVDRGCGGRSVDWHGLCHAIYFAYRALHAEVERHRKVAQQLRATQEELAASEHQAGRLEERERLSREIHDTVAQGLSSIVLLARAAKASGEPDTPLTRQLVQQLAMIETVAADNLAEARRFVRDLASPDVEQSLPQALRAVVKRMRARGAALGEKTEFRLEFAGSIAESAPGIVQPVAAAVLRFVQEGLSNVVKHAQAETAVVTLGLFGDAVTIDVVDNGIGMDNAPDTGSFGLAGLRRRIESLGGTMDIESHPGSGTALAATLPLTSRELPSRELPSEKEI